MNSCIASRLLNGSIVDASCSMGSIGVLLLAAVVVAPVARVFAACDSEPLPPPPCSDFVSPFSKSRSKLSPNASSPSPKALGFSRISPSIVESENRFSLSNERRSGDELHVEDPLGISVDWFERRLLLLLLLLLPDMVTKLCREALLSDGASEARVAG